MTIANISSVKMCITVLAWMGVLLAATHRSHPPVVLGRYSWNYAYLLGLLVGVAATLSLVKSSWYLKLYQTKTGILVSAISLLVSIGVVELVLRLVDPLGISYYELAGNYVRDKLADDQLVFRHKPSWETSYGRVRVTYNERGLRDRPILPKGEDEYRVLALGDSVTFGWGVDQEKTFVARLEPLLQGSLHRPVRVINSGVGGYNTVQELTYFKQEGGTLQPDLVMLTYVQNDIEVERKPFDPWAQSSPWGKPFPDMLETMMGKLWLYRLVYHTYNHALPKPQAGPAPSPSQETTGWRQSMAALRELADMCEERKISFIIFFERLDPRDNTLLLEDVVRHAKGVPVRDMAPWFAGLNIASHVNSKVDGHPNAEGHRVMAEHMAEDIMNYLAVQHE